MFQTRRTKGDSQPEVTIPYRRYPQLSELLRPDTASMREC